jgi:hypothetical protein
MVYETFKIYSEKFTTNNSENNYKLSYTPKLPHQPTAHTSSRTITPQLLTDKLIKEKETHPRNKNNKQKKRQPFLVAF